MLKIFLAEDEVVVRETIKRMIPWEELGFELVGEAADGEMALLIRQQPDLLITDIKMPFMDGLTLARLAKKEIPGLKVVILSGYDDFNYAKQAIGIGVEDYLLKPITKNALIERLSEIRSRYEHEKTQKEYYEKFQREMQAYEKNSSRDFFEALVGGSMDMMEVYKRAEKLGLDIVADREMNILRGKQSHWNFWKTFLPVIHRPCCFEVIFSPMVYFLRDREKLLKKIQERVWMRSVRF